MSMLSLTYPWLLLLLLLLPLPWLLARLLRQRRLRVASLLPFRLAGEKLSGPPPSPPLLPLLLQTLILVFVVLAAVGPLLLTHSLREPVALWDNSITGTKPAGVGDAILTVPASPQERADVSADWSSAIAAVAHRLHSGASKVVVETRLSEPTGLPALVDWRSHDKPPEDRQAFVSIRREQHSLLVGVSLADDAPAGRIHVSYPARVTTEVPIAAKGYTLLRLPTMSGGEADGLVITMRLLPQDAVPENDTLRVVLSHPAFAVQGEGGRRLSKALEALGWQEREDAGFVIARTPLTGRGIGIVAGAGQDFGMIRPYPGEFEHLVAGLDLPASLPVAEMPLDSGRPVITAEGRPVVSVDVERERILFAFEPDRVAWGGQGAFAVLLARLVEVLGYPPTGVRCLDVGGKAMPGVNLNDFNGDVSGVLRAGLYEDARGLTWSANVLGLIEDGGPDERMLEALAGGRERAAGKPVPLYASIGLLALAALVLEALVFVFGKER